jgi:1,4-dihydroxy-2-naphthoate octaprenyltransferase
MGPHSILERLSPEQHQLLNQESHVSVILANMEGHVIACSPGAGTLFGYSRNEMIGSHVKVFHPPQNFAKILPELFRTALQKGTYDHVITLIRKDNTEFLAHIIVTRITDEKGTPIALMGVTAPAHSKKEMGWVKKWLTALRAPFFSATILPIFLGTVIAMHAGFSLDFWGLFYTILGMIAIHAGVNLANDYFDHKSGNDELNLNATPFSGGSRVIQDGIIPPHHVLYASLGFLLVGSLIGLYLNTLAGGNLILVIGLLGVGIGFFYSAPPFAASYHRLGELFVAVGFGPLIVVGSYVVQAKSFSLLPLYASVPLALLIAAVLFMNQFQDVEADVKARKMNLVNTFGKKASVMWLKAGVGIAYAYVLIGILVRVFPLSSLLVLLTLPIAWNALRVAEKEYDHILELIPANAGIVTLHFTFGALLVLSYTFSFWGVLS